MTDSLPPIVSCAIVLAHAESEVVCKYRARKGERSERGVEREREREIGRQTDRPSRTQGSRERRERKREGKMT